MPVKRKTITTAIAIATTPADFKPQHAPTETPKRKPQSTALPQEGFVRLPTVLANFPISKSGFYAGIKNGIYPKGVKLGPRLTAWKVEDIRQLIANAGNAANDAQA